MFWVAYILIFIFCGILSWKKIYPQKDPIATILIGFLWGLILATVFPFLLSFILPLAKAVNFAMFIGIAISVTVAVLQRKDLKDDILEAKNYFLQHKKWLLIMCLAIIIIGAPYLYLVSRTFFIDGDGWLATGIRSAYGDVPFHLMQIFSFVHGENFPPQAPDFAGTPNNYPMLPYILSATLIKLGAGLRESFLVPAFLLSLLSIMLAIFVCWKITRNKKAAIIAIIIFLLSSNLGFWYFFQAHGFNVFDAQVKFQGMWVDEATNIPQYNIVFMNFLLGSFLPQRGILFGLPIFLAVLFLWFKKDGRSIVASSFLVAFLPLLHAHTFLALMMVGGVFAAIQIVSKKNVLAWVSFFAISVVFGLFAIKLVQSSSSAFLNFLHFSFGWQKGEDNFFWFWFKNLGFILPILILALFSKKISKEIKIWYLAFLPLFVLPNLLIFSPWDWDNSKFFYFWYLASSFLAALYLAKLLEVKNVIFKFLALILFLLLTIGGGAEALRIWHFSDPGLKLFSPEKQELAEFVKEETLPDAIFLSSTDHISPLVLSGRKRYIGYLGWLFAHGVNYSLRLEQERKMFSGGEEAKIELQRSIVNYVLIGPEEKNEFNVNRPFFEENYEKIYDKNNYQIFKVK